MPIEPKRQKTRFEPLKECQRCGICCGPGVRILKGERTLERARKALEHKGMQLETIAHGNTVHYALPFTGGKCVFFEKGRGCEIHSERGLICRAFGFSVIGERIVLSGASCPVVKGYIEHKKSLPHGTHIVLIEGKKRGSYKEKEVPLLYISKEEILENPFLLNCFNAAKQLYEKDRGREFKEQEKYEIIIEPYVPKEELEKAKKRESLLD